MSKRVITAEVDQEWFDILGQLTRHQDGFVWIKVEEADGTLQERADRTNPYLLTTKKEDSNE